MPRSPWSGRTRRRPAEARATSDRFLSRLERFAEVDSTQRVVRGWLDAGLPEVAVAVADVQHAGRGRSGRTWQAPPGAAPLLSVGVRPPPPAARHGRRA